MNQIKIGKFIASLRKEKSLTQSQLAEKLNLSDKTISKWETGSGLPEVSLMIPLCEELGITVNELLSGERLSPEEYKSKAEKNMMDLVKEREQNKKKVICIYLILAMVVIELLTAGFFLDHFETSAIVKIIALTLAFAIAILGIIASVILEFNSGYWQCKECGNSFIPTFGEYFKSPHIGFTRKLKCPECGHKGYCKHKLTK